MKLPFLSVIPRPILIETLREDQDSILLGLKDNVFAIVLAYRMICRRILRHGDIPMFCDLPRHLTVGIGRVGISRAGAVLSGPTYATICRRLRVSLRHIAESQLQLLAPPRDIFDDESQERERRTAIYARQVARLDAIAMSWSSNERQGPQTKPVYCKDLRRWFTSGREAASFLNEGNRRSRYRRKDIRTAIVRRLRCGGLRFSYDGPDEGRPTARVMLCGTERAVRCLDLDIEPFESRGQAARFAGVADSTMKKALAGDGRIGEYTFEYCDVPSRIERSYVERFPVRVAAPKTEDAALFPAIAIRNFSKFAEPKKRRAVRDDRRQATLFAEGVER